MKHAELFAARLRGLLPGPIHVVGGGVEGRSTLAFLRALGFSDLVLRDRNAALDSEVPSVLGEGYLAGIPDGATIVRSAGIRPDLPELAEAAARGCRILSQLQIFLACWQGVLGKRAIGVTATLGKGTVCSLLSEMLAEAGIDHLLGGNIGTAMLDLLAGEGRVAGRRASGAAASESPAQDKEQAKDAEGKVPAAHGTASVADLPDLAVLELSSFQLFDLAPLPGFADAVFAPRVAVFGRVTVEHLDWHVDRDEYRAAKGRLALFQRSDDDCVHLADDEGSRALGVLGRGRRHAIGAGGEFRPEGDVLRDAAGTAVLRLEELRVPGRFQLENIGLAWAAARCAGASDAACAQGARVFAGLRHRLMFAGEARGIRYYNDSYATRPEATIAAVDAMRPHATALILGGSDKGIDFSELAAALRATAHLRYVALIGATAGRLRQALTESGETPFALEEFPGLPEAVAACEEALSQGGAVLLSPACASFGLFRNYKERGEAFLELAAARTGRAA